MIGMSEKHLAAETELETNAIHWWTFGFQQKVAQRPQTRHLAAATPMQVGMMHKIGTCTVHR